MKYRVETVTRISEGASWEDIINGDAYETAYVIYDEYDDIIMDTTDEEIAREYMKTDEDELLENDNRIKEKIEMLIDLLIALKNAKTDKEKETAYRNLEKVGVDRVTADIMVKVI